MEDHATDTDVLTTIEAAALLRVHPVSLLRWMASCKSPVPGVKMGRDYRYSRAAIMRALENNSSEGQASHRQQPEKAVPSASVFPLPIDISKRLQRPPRKVRPRQESRIDSSALRKQRKERAGQHVRHGNGST